MTDFFKKNKYLIISFGLALIGVLFCSKSSPLYVINDKDDCNTFYILGKGIFTGKVPYRDLYEQKGPYIFLIYGIGYLISGDSFIGVFLLEILAMVGCFYWTAKTFELFLNKNCELALIIFAIIPYLGCMWTEGGQPEEFLLPFIAYSIYSMTTTLKYDKDISRSQLIFYGAFSAFVFWMKYSLLLFFAAVIIIALIYDYSKKSDIKRLFRIFAYFTAGFFLLTLPVVCYFVLNGSMGILIQTYFVNMFMNYDRKTDGGILSKLALIGKTTLMAFAGNRNTLIRNALFTLFFIFGTIDIITKKIRLSHKVFYIFTVVLTLFGIFYSGHYSGYYLLAAIHLVLPGIVLFVNVFNRLVKYERAVKLINALAMISFLFLGVFIFNYEKIPIPKAKLAQYRFAELIRKRENPTLIDYGTTDWGFFITSGAEPNFRYFSVQFGAQEEQLKQMQSEFVKKGEADFVITAEVDFPYGVVWEAMDMSEMDNYELLDSVEQISNNSRYVFNLYSLKNKNKQI